MVLCFFFLSFAGDDASRGLLLQCDARLRRLRCVRVCEFVHSSVGFVCAAVCVLVATPAKFAEGLSCEWCVRIRFCKEFMFVCAVFVGLHSWWWW